MKKKAKREPAVDVCEYCKRATCEGDCTGAIAARRGMREKIARTFRKP